MKNIELQKAGLKITVPRKKILELFELSEKRHFRAEDIYKALLDAGTDVSLATVYRVLTQFEQAGLIIRHKFENDHAVYELRDEDHHDHMICVDTGDIIEFKSQIIEDAQDEIALKHGYEIVDHSLVLYVRKLPL